MQEKDFVSYEYKTVVADAKEQSRVTDVYEAFGWEVTSQSTALKKTTLSLKRNRNIAHKTELNRLERQASNMLVNLKNLERSKTTTAKVFSWIFGIVATLVFGGAMCIVMLNEHSLPALICGILTGIAGIVLCAVNYPIYTKITERTVKNVLPAIDDCEEKLANILEEGNYLLQTEII